MICKVRKTLDKYYMLPHGSKALVALSGGADSMSLLYSLVSLREERAITVMAAHVNHCIRGEEADRDELFVRQKCAELGVELHVLKADIPYYSFLTGEGLEECGRRIRYSFLNSLCEENTFIATAHNLNDCAETFIFNFSRGTGLKGLCSVPAVRGNIIRPLIDCSREEIELYCKENSVDYVTDSTNSDVEYSRNRIRHNIIPQLKIINPSFELAVSRCIESLNEDNSLLNELSAGLYEKCKLKNGYKVDVLLDSHPALLNRTIRIMIEDSFNIKPDFTSVNSVCDVIRNGGLVQIENGIFVRVNNGILDFPDIKPKEFWEYNSHEGLNNIPGFEIEIKIINKSDINSIKNCNNDCLEYRLDFNKIIGKTVFRNRRDGDSINFAGRKCTKTLKKLFNEAKIPTEKRDNVLVAADSEGIIFVENFGVAQRCAVDEKTVKIIDFIIRRV